MDSVQPREKFVFVVVFSIDDPVTLKIVRFPLKHSKAGCKASSRHYIYSELSFFIFLKQF